MNLNGERRLVRITGWRDMKGDTGKDDEEEGTAE